ncbi:S9 family peptidase [Serratia ureilytica]
MSRWVQTQPQIDSERIGLWGTSFGGCHVFGAAAADPAIKCIVSQLAFADGNHRDGENGRRRKTGVHRHAGQNGGEEQATGKEMFVAVTGC